MVGNLAGTDAFQVHLIARDWWGREHSPVFCSVQEVQAPMGSNKRFISVEHSFGACTYNVSTFLDIEGDDTFSPALKVLQGLQNLHLVMLSHIHSLLRADPAGTSNDLILQLFPALLSSSMDAYTSALRISKASYLKSQLAAIKQVQHPSN